MSYTCRFRLGVGMYGSSSIPFHGSWLRSNDLDCWSYTCMYIEVTQSNFEPTWNLEKLYEQQNLATKRWKRNKIVCLCVCAVVKLEIKSNFHIFSKHRIQDELKQTHFPLISRIHLICLYVFRFVLSSPYGYSFLIYRRYLIEHFSCFDISLCRVCTFPNVYGMMKCCLRISTLIQFKRYFHFISAISKALHKVLKKPVTYKDSSKVTWKL